MKQHSLLMYIFLFSPASPFKGWHSWSPASIAPYRYHNSVTPTPCMSCFTTSTNHLWGLPLLLLSIFNTRCSVYSLSIRYTHPSISSLLPELLNLSCFSDLLISNPLSKNLNICLFVTAIISKPYNIVGLSTLSLLLLFFCHKSSITLISTLFYNSLVHCPLLWIVGPRYLHSATFTTFTLCSFTFYIYENIL